MTNSKEALYDLALSTLPYGSSCFPALSHCTYQVASGCQQLSFAISGRQVTFMVFPHSLRFVEELEDRVLRMEGNLQDGWTFVRYYDLWPLK